MKGITNYGLYVPYNRLERKKIGQAFEVRTPPGEKAVANYDEDSLTLAVAASLNCLSDADTDLAGVYFATTTPTNMEKQAGAQIASVLDLEGEIRTADFSGTLRAGANAMLAALDGAKEGNNTLVAMADCRLGAPDSKYEIAFGDGAAAFVFGEDNLVAEYLDHHSVSYDFTDTWRTAEDKYVRFYDEKFALTQGYIPFVTESIRGVLEKTGIAADQIKKVVLDAPSEKHIKSIMKAVGLKAEQMQAPLFADIGYTGAANAPMMLASALAQSAPGDIILYVSYGEGSDAIIFKKTSHAKEIGAGRDLEYFSKNKISSMTYEKYLQWRDSLEMEPPRRLPLSRSSLPDFYRKRKKNLACYGSKCTVCGTPHFPPTEVCVECKSVGKMEPYLFRDKEAKLATYSFDYLAISPDSPNIVAVIDFEGGGRMFTYLMDCELEKVVINMPVELSYRKMFSVDGITTYFWKCVPVYS